MIFHALPVLDIIVLNPASLPVTKCLPCGPELRERITPKCPVAGTSRSRLRRSSLTAVDISVWHMLSVLTGMSTKRRNEHHVIIEQHR